MENVSAGRRMQYESGSVIYRENGAMTGGEIAILISGISLAISIAGFVWSIFKEFIFVKPKLSVSFSVFHVLQQGMPNVSTLGLSVTNMGPGPIIIHSCIVRTWKGWFKRAGWGLIQPLIDAQSRSTGGVFTVPATLEPGQSRVFYFLYDAIECFLISFPDVYRVGVHDTYGRTHYTPRKSVRAARMSHTEDFKSGLEHSRE
jgi:hypothetical protein